jgi:hypothetical protein
MPYRNITEKEIMENVKHVRCKRAYYCRHKDILQACIVCDHNANGLHRQDNFEPKIPGIKIL